MNCAAIIMRTELSRAADAAMRREENGTRKNRIIYGNYNYTARTGTENNNMAKISGLGRGLENIFSDNAVEERNDITKLKITQIEPRSDQPRKDFDPESLAQLADSIAAHGVLQPLLVRESGDGFYEIIAGERRWRASKLAGLTEVPVIVIEADELKAAQVALIENIQREDLNPIEEAMAYKRLMEEFHLKQDEIADRVAKSRTAVTNSMRLLKLSSKVQEMVIADMISAGHARALLGISDEALQETTAMKVFDEKLSVRETEKLVKNLVSPAKKVKTEKNTAEDAIYESLEEKMKGIMGTKVSIQRKKNNKGKIEIEYYSRDELERIIDLFESIR